MTEQYTLRCDKIDTTQDRRELSEIVLWVLQDKEGFGKFTRLYTIYLYMLKNKFKVYLTKESC